MKGNNFIWAVKQMQKGKKVTRKFKGTKTKYIKLSDEGFIHNFDENNNFLVDHYLIYEDYLAEDWILL